MKRNLLSTAAGLVLCLVLLAYGVTEEVPVGGVQGILTMSENGRALPGATLMLRPISREEHTRIRSAEADASGKFRLSNVPAGEYLVEAYAKAHSLEAARLTVAEGEATALELALKPHEPHLDLYTSQRVFTPDEQAQFEAHGFAPDDTMDVEVFALDIDAVAKEGGIREVVSTLAYPSTNEPNPLARLGKRTTSFKHPVLGRDGEGVFIEHVKLPLLEEGMYWVRCNVGPARRATFVNVTRMALVTKTSGRDVLCYATDITSGKPMPGVAVSYLNGQQLSPGGTTDAQGLARFRRAEADQWRGVVMGAKEKSRAVVGFYGDEQDSKGLRTMVYTERPVYRPGDTVSFKGIVRRLEGLAYALPKETIAEVTVHDADGDVVEQIKAPISAHGTFSGSYTISAEARPGAAELQIDVGGSIESHWVNVSAYRKPEFTVEVKPLKEFYVRGDTARFEVKCAYYHGGPVVGAEVNAWLSRANYWSYAPMDGDEEEGYSGSGEFVSDFEGRTDERGIAVITVPTRAKGEPEQLENDLQFTLNASVADPGGEYFDGNGSVLVTRGEFALTATLDEYIVSPGQPARLKVEARSHDGDKPIAGIEVRVLEGVNEWTRNETRFVERKRSSVRTAADGTATIESKPPAGSTTFKVVATDKRGNEIAATEWVWVDGRAASAPAPDGTLSLRLDKRSYKVGETAKLLVQTSEPGGSALITVEGDRVYTTRLVGLESGATTIELPIEGSFSPNAFVTAAYVKDKKFMEATRQVAVDLERKTLQVSIASDKPDYEPGDTATYTITTLDENGQAVSAEVSLGVVDESIYAIADDSTNIVDEFYPKRYHSVSTNHSFPEVYLDGGDKAASNVEVRSRFLDTAYWNPAVQTDAGGKAQVRVTLPDNLTQWRATAVAASDATAVGMTTHKVRARKPLMVRLQGPDYLVIRDERTLTAVVHNETGRDQRVHVQLETVGLSVEGALTSDVTIRSGSQESVVWTISGKATGEGSATAKAWIDGGASDGVRHVVAIRPFGRAVVETHSGEIDGADDLRVAVRPGADVPSGRVRLTLSPSLGSSMLSGLDDLIDYPYGCVEQTMSRFLPALVVGDLVKRLGLPAPSRASEIPKIAADSMVRLKRMQHSDGGWGWWEQDDSDPGMTALVLEGLHRASGTGFDDHGLAERGVLWGKREFEAKKTTGWSRTERLAMMAALARHGSGPFVAPLLAAENLSQASATEVALPLRVPVGRGDRPAEVLKLVERLVAKAKGSDTYAWWDEDGYGNETTATALDALSEARPNHPILPRVVRRLLAQRRGGGWVSTRDTSAVLMALARYLPTTGETAATGTVRILVNGTVYRTVPLAGTDRDLRLDIPFADLKLGDNVVRLERDGPGRFYYTTEVRQTVGGEVLGRVINDSGLEVTRTYKTMQPMRMEDGTMRLRTSERGVERAQLGDVLVVELTIRSREAREFVMIEDPFPSGFRPVERGDWDRYDEWTWWYSNMAAYDDRMAVFSRHLPAGLSTITYTLRAENPGVAHALPTSVVDMYRPEVGGSSASTRLTVAR